MKRNRRRFIKQSLAITSAFFIVPRHVLGKGFIAPSDKIHLGQIGTGVQGRILMNYFSRQEQVKCIAASDVEKNKLNLFEHELIKSYKKNQPDWNVKGIKKSENYKDLINNPEIDAIVIATPDHWHAKNCIDALNSGKDVYCEKPLSHTINEGRMIAKAVKKNKAVFQTGSMQRSDKLFRYACELIRNGYLGDIKKVTVYVGDPAIACDLPAEIKPPSLNWDGWLGSAPIRPYNSILSPPVEQRHYPRWRFYEEYGGGIIADWGAHMFDIAQWALGMDHSGPVFFLPPKGRNLKLGLKMFYSSGIEMCHDQIDMNDHYGLRFEGSEGVLKIRRGELVTTPENISKIKIKSNEVKLYNSDNHYLDWINSIKTRKQPICDVEIGHRTASICQLSNIAYKFKRKLEWNPKKEKFVNDKEANEFRTKKYRKPYTIL